MAKTNWTVDQKKAIDKRNSNILVSASAGSGKTAVLVERIIEKVLNEFLDVRIISKEIGDAATLKLLRSTYTKTLSAILIESYQIAMDYNLEKEFFEVIAITEGDDFKDKSLSRIKNTLSNSKRKSEELEEIIRCFDAEELTMVRAALEKFNRL